MQSTDKNPHKPQTTIKQIFMVNPNIRIEESHFIYNLYSNLSIIRSKYFLWCVFRS